MQLNNRKFLVALLIASFAALPAAALAADAPAPAAKAPAAAAPAAPAKAAPAKVTPEKVVAVKKEVKHIKHHKIVANAKVKALQEALNQHGATLKADGFYGKATREALVKFQKINGLKATGHANKATLEKLGLEAVKAPAKPVKKK